MFHNLFRRFYFVKTFPGKIIRKKWMVLLGLLIGLWCLSFLLISIEGPESPFKTVADTTWFYIVTITTVGYGDMSPSTLLGKAIAVTIMLGGIGCMAIVASGVVEIIINLGRKKMLGKGTYKGEGQIIIFGYHESETENLVEENRADQEWGDLDIVLCSSRLKENPMPESVTFIKGELHSEDVMTRANVASATKIIIHGHDDSQCIAVAIMVCDVNKVTDIVVHVRKQESSKILQKLGNENLSCIEDMDGELIIQEMQDKGIVSQFLIQLLSNKVGEEFYRLYIPDRGGLRWSFKDLMNSLKDKYESLTLAVFQKDGSLVVNPKNWDSFMVHGGESLVIVAEDRLLDVDWGRV